MAATSSSSSSLLRLLLLLAVFFATGRPDTASDLQQCGTQLVGMQTCITYVQGTARAPTPDCCTGLKDVLAKSPKCLCILVKDHDDPQLPIKINVTRAVALPGACSTPANISACPQLLNLPPDSKEAEIFKQAGRASSQGKGNTTAGDTAATGTPARATPAASSGWRGVWAARGVEVAGGLLFFVMHLLLFSTS